MMPLVSQGPAKSLPIAVPISIHGTHVKTFLLSLFIQVFYVEVNLVRELVPRNLPALIFYVTIRIHPDNDPADFCTIRLHICHNLRLIVH